MSDPYYVSANENLRLEIKECNDHAIVKIDGKQILKVEKKDVPAKIFLTKGLKRSDKETVHHLQVQLWRKEYNYLIDATVYSIDSSGGEQAIKSFKEKKTEEASQEKSISDYYLELVQPKKADESIRTDEFYFQFD